MLRPRERGSGILDPRASCSIIHCLCEEPEGLSQQGAPGQPGVITAGLPMHQLGGVPSTVGIRDYMVRQKIDPIK